MKPRALMGLGGLVIVAATGVFFAVRSSKADGNKAGGSTVTVTRGTVVDKALAVGKIEPDVEVGVKSQVSGVVQKLYADAGDFVKIGTPLIQIKPNPTPLELVESRRQIELREIELENLQRDIDRKRSLKDQGLVSTQEFEAAQQRLAESKLQVQMAKERLELLQQGRVQIAEDRIESVIKAPITGYVLEKAVQMGDPVVPLTSYQEGTVLMRMSEMKRLLFRGTVDEIDVGRLKEGMPVEIKIGALPQAKIRGVLSKISLKAKQQESATVFPVEIILTETGGTTLRAGYSANADIIIAHRDSVLTIPERVVTFAGDSATVTVALPNDRTEVRTIKVGLSDAINIEVTSGLKIGEQLAEKPVKELK
ncbi:MAG: efflux RND transporter periplasmic adaptor subunit [Gemmatimonadetes bacterium]|nr:efflux RND transporter periplasmic adaptor subunit [Gemmatimonadota bacterium]